VSNQTEEQQIEQLKEWWKDNGTPLMIGAVLGLSGFFGWKYWTEAEIAYQESASNLYAGVAEQLELDDSALLPEKAEAVKAQYPDSSYAILSAFHLAKIAVEQEDLDKAAAEFTWVIDNHNSSELADIAKVRLARVLVAQEKTELALTYLNFDSDSGYFEIANLIKGDALMAIGDKAGALEAYKAADNAGKVTANHATLKLKIEALTASISDTSSESIENSEASDATIETEKVESEGASE
jgi:predicted negative regulator of RcsB-dependent stress response